MIATSICQKALAVILMMLIISALMGCKKDVTQTTLAGALPLASGSYVGYVNLGTDSLSGIYVKLEQLSDTTVRVFPESDFLQPFDCQVSLDDGILQNVNDSSANFFSINTESNPFELEIQQGRSSYYWGQQVN